VKQLASGLLSRRASLFWPSWSPLDAASFALLYSILPFLIKELQGQQADPTPLAVMVTRITALYAGAQLLSAPLLGQLSAIVIGRRTVLLGCIGAGRLALLMVGCLVRSIAALAIAWAIARAGFRSAGHYTQAAITDGTSDNPSRRTDAFGLLGAAGLGLGLVLGPAAGGGLLGGVNPHLPFLAGAAVGVVNAALRLPETRVRYPNNLSQPVLCAGGGADQRRHRPLLHPERAWRRRGARHSAGQIVIDELIGTPPITKETAQSRGGLVAVGEQVTTIFQLGHS